MPTCTKYLKLDAANVPTGEYGAFDTAEGERHDFRTPRLIAPPNLPFHGYDNYYVTREDDNDTMETQLTLLSPPLERGRIQLQVISNQLGLQMYTANGMDSTGEVPFAKFGSIAIEPSAYVDAPNCKHFPSILLPVGQCRTQSITFRFTVIPP